MESFINCSNFWVENMDLFKTNGAIKLFLGGFLQNISSLFNSLIGKTCIIATAFGPFQSNYSRDYKSSL